MQTSSGQRFWLSLGLVALSTAGHPLLLNTGAVAIASLVLPRPAQAASLTHWRFDPATSKLEMTVPAGVTPRYFLMAQPARIVVDLPNTELGQVPTTGTYSGAVRQVRVAQFQPGLTRIVLELSPDAVLSPRQAELRPEDSSSASASRRWVLQPLLANASPVPVAARPAAGVRPVPTTATVAPSPRPVAPSPRPVAPSAPAVAPQPPTGVTTPIRPTPAAPPRVEPNAIEIPVEPPPVAAAPAPVVRSPQPPVERPPVAVPPAPVVRPSPVTTTLEQERTQQAQGTASTGAAGLSAPGTAITPTITSPTAMLPSPDLAPSAAADSLPPPTFFGDRPPTVSVPPLDPNAIATPTPPNRRPEPSPPPARVAPPLAPSATATPTPPNPRPEPSPPPARVAPPPAAPVQQPAPSREVAPAPPAARPAAVAAISPDVLLPSGTVLNLRYPRNNTLDLKSDRPWQEVLVLHQPVRDTRGNVLVPEGTQIIGRFETGTSGSRFVTQAISLQGRNLPLRAQSSVLEGDRQISNSTLLRNSAIGAAGLGLVGVLTGGIGIVVGLAAGAAAGAATTLFTAPQPASISPNQVVEVRLVEDLPRI